MSLPYVTKVTFIDGKIVLTVELNKYLANQSVEISGYATQNSGGLATFYDVQSVGAEPDGTVVMFVSATPSAQFNDGEPVTVSLRAARAWVVVLTQAGRMGGVEDGTPAPDGATWDTVQTVGYVSADAWSSTAAGQGSAAGASFPPTQPAGPPGYKIGPK
jgi:hypothetical protein